MQERFRIKRADAYRQIGFAAVIENLMPRGIKTLPETEYQARPLAKLPSPELQAQAWEQAQADSGLVYTAGLPCGRYPGETDGDHGMPTAITLQQSVLLECNFGIEAHKKPSGTMITGGDLFWDKE